MFVSASRCSQVNKKLWIWLQDSVSKQAIGSWQWLKNTVSSLFQFDSEIYELILLSKIMNKANKLLDDGGVFTIRMTGSYLIHTQHTLVTPHAEVYH
jgi:hypothetical protein